MPSADLERARELLIQGGHNVVAVRGDDVLVGDARGLTTLLAWFDEGRDLAGYSAADTVVGRAASLMYVNLGVTAVHGVLMSRGATVVLDEHGISWSADQLVDQIRNRDDTDMCPMERSVQDITDPQTAPPVIAETRRKLMAANMGGAKPVN